MRASRWVEVGAVVACAFGWCLQLEAQVLGSIRGTVVQDGVAVPGASVELSGPLLAIRITASTSADGTFEFRGLPLGSYQLVASLEGFSIASQEIVVGIGQAAVATIELPGAGVLETITVASETSRDSTPVPTWNTWFASTDVTIDSPVATLRPGKNYDFHLDLSRVPLEAAGVASALASDRLLEELLRAYEGNALSIDLVVRPVVLGPAIELVPATTSVWSDGQWVEAATQDIARFSVRLGDLLGWDLESGTRTASSWAEAAELERAGGVRFGIRAKSKGCATIILVLFGADGKIPLDALVRTVSVGGAKCGNAAESEAMSPGLVDMLRLAPSEYDVAGALQFYEIDGNEGTSGRTVGLYIPRNPIGDCATYSWDFKSRLSKMFFDDSIVRTHLNKAQSSPEEFPKLAASLSSRIFPLSARGKKCGRDGVLEALVQVASRPAQSLYVSLVSVENERRFLPLGLLFALEEEVEGTRLPVYTNPPSLIQPLPGRTPVPQERCVRDWTFFLPRFLELVDDGGGGEVSLPNSIAAHLSVKRDLDDVRELFETAVEEPESLGDDPIGMVLLAHQASGAIYFESSSVNLPAEMLYEARFPLGSVAVVAACSTGELLKDFDLIESLSEAGFGTVVLSPFPVDAEFGKKFATEFTQEVIGRAGESRIDQMFSRALSKAAGELGNRGMALEFLIAGWPGAKACKP